MINFNEIYYYGVQFETKFQTFSIIGNDAEDYLQRQITNDVKSLPNNSFCHGALIDGGGKIESIFIVLKLNKTNFMLLAHPDLKASITTRIEKYHFAEDFAMQDQGLQNYYFGFGPNSKSEDGYHGILWGDNHGVIAQKPFRDDLRSIQAIEVKDIRLSLGFPVWGQEIGPELINNTIYNEIAVSHEKGCFLGNETISKIESRRGAAYNMVAIEYSGVPIEITKTEKITINDEKIGEVRNSFTWHGKNYFFALINRQNRIDLKKISFNINENQYNGVVRYFPLWKGSDTERSTKLYEEALNLYHSKKTDEAIAALLQAIKIDENNEDAHEILGVIYGHQNDYHKAIELMEHLKEINPNSVMAYTNLSVYHMKLGDKETAEKFKSEATVKTFERYGQEAQAKRQEQESAENKEKEYQRKSKMFLQVLDLDPEDALANYSLGDLYFEKNEFEKAIHHLQTAIKTNPKYTVAYLKLAKSYLSISEKVEAKNTLIKGIEVGGQQGEFMPANEMQLLLIGLT